MHMPSWWSVKHCLLLGLMMVYSSAPPPVFSLGLLSRIRNVLVAFHSSTCSNMTLTPLVNDTLRVEMDECHLEVNGTEVTSFPWYLEELVQVGVVLFYNKTGQRLLYLLNSVAVVTVNITCYLPCADISLPLTPPTTPANGHLTYSRSVVDGVEVIAARVVCNHGYQLEGDEVVAVFRAEGRVWGWASTHGTASCVDSQVDPPDPDPDPDPNPSPPSDVDSTGPRVAAIAAAAVCLIIVIAILVRIVSLIIVLRRRRYCRNTTGSTCNTTSGTGETPLHRSVQESVDESATPTRRQPGRVHMCSRVLQLNYSEMQGIGDPDHQHETANAGTDPTNPSFSVEVERGDQPKVMVYTGVIRGGVAVKAA